MGSTNDSLFDRAWVSERLDHALSSIRADADGVEALFRGSEASHLRIAESAVFQAADVEEGRVVVRAIVGRGEARATTSDLSDAGLEACARQAIAQARAAPAAPQPIELPAPKPIPAADPRCLDEATACLDGASKARWLDEACRAHEVDDLALAGRFHTGRLTSAVRSTRGVDAYHQGSFADLCLSALERPAGHAASSSRAQVDARIDEEAVRAMARTVHGECHRAHDPMQVPTGAWDVVLAPAATAELLEWMAWTSFSSESFDDGLSFIKGREGETITGESVTITDDGSMPSGLGVAMPFDVEGQPKERVVLVEEGRARGIVHDSRTARRFGCEGTGHAQLDEIWPTAGSRADHLHIEPGQATVDELVAQVERGLLVTRFHYVNGMIDPRRAVMTGLLRDGAFLIEDGRLGRAVTSMRFTDSILEAFSRIPGPGGISKSLEAQAPFFHGWSCFVTPWMLVPGLQFTSGR